MDIRMKKIGLLAMVVVFIGGCANTSFGIGATNEQKAPSTKT